MENNNKNNNTVPVAAAEKVQVMNNLNKETQPYRKDNNYPDILRNLQPDCYAEKEKNYNKEKINPEKPVNTDIYPTNAKTVGKLVSVEDSEHIKYTERRRVKRGLCFLAWIFCCPCMAMGYSRRESPDFSDPDDLRDDPCLPCYFDPAFDPRNPQLNVDSNQGGHKS